LTASAFEEERQKILSVGCDDFISKPAREELILAKLAEHLGVRYHYEEEPSRTPLPKLNPQPQPKPLALSDFSGITDAWIAQLQDAAIQADSDLIASLLNQLPDRHSGLVDTLKSLIHDFQFEQILELTQQITTSPSASGYQSGAKPPG